MKYIETYKLIGIAHDDGIMGINKSYSSCLTVVC